MANYLVINSKFQPFSFERYLQPYQMYGEAYKEIENQYGELAAKADVWDEMANEHTDPYAYNMYKTYSNDLKNKAEQLAKEGLTPASRQDMLKMKQRYSSDIIPIEQAYNRRQELINEQRKALLSDPSLMYDIDYRAVSLDDLIKNPGMSYSNVSGNELYNKGKETAISASSRITNIDLALKNQYWRIRQGYGEEAANDFLLNQANIPELKEAVDRIVSQSNVTENNKNRAINYVISGIMTGMSYKENYQNNRNYIDPVEAERLQLAKDEFDFMKSKWEDDLLGIKLPNGNRVKDIGGGKVRIVYPDGTVEIMKDNKKTNNSNNNSNSSGYEGDEDPFPGLQFKMWNKNSATNVFQEGTTTSRWTSSIKGFSPTDKHQIEFTDLSIAMQNNLKSELVKYGITPDDVIILEDVDSLTDNHYQVILKESIPQEKKEKPTIKNNIEEPKDSTSIYNIGL